jgi:penicillin-binding protein 2
LLVEKYLTDSLRTERLADVDRIANASLMPEWLPREQYKADSTRAFYWFKITQDSSFINKYIFPVRQSNKKPVNKKEVEKKVALLPENKQGMKKSKKLI